MKILNVFWLLCAAQGLPDTSKNATVEVMFVVSSEVQMKLDKRRGTKSYMFDLFKQMESRYALLDIDLALFDFVIQDDAEIFGVDGKYETLNRTAFLNRLTNETYGLPPFTSRNHEPDAKLYFLPSDKLEWHIEGVARMYSVCTNESIGLVETKYEQIEYTAKVAVHELGHILGAPHSNSYYCLEKYGYGKAYWDENGERQFNATAEIPSDTVMYGSVGEQNITWSDCSKAALDKESLIALTKSAERPLCLFEESPPHKLFSEPVCGNGFLEDGEECDSGLCCSDDCKLKKRGTLCRSGTGDCDFDDFCSGLEAECPVWNVADGTTCENGEGLCFRGDCKTSSDNTVDDECQYFFGPEARQSNQCSPDFVNDDYPMCGTLYCIEANLTYFDTRHKARPEPYYHRQSIVAGIVTCAKVDFSEKRFTEKAASGTVCGPNSLCKWDGECTAASSFLKVCPGNGTCSGHGRCYTKWLSSKYECECEVIEDVLIKTEWHGTDCSEFKSSFTITAQVLAFIIATTVLAFSAVLLRKLVASKEPSPVAVDNDNEISLVQANQSENILNNETE